MSQSPARIRAAREPAGIAITKKSPTVVALISRPAEIFLDGDRGGWSPSRVGWTPHHHHGGAKSERQEQAR
jgi:hypothetical protein